VFLFQFSHRLFRAGLILATGPPGLGPICCSLPLSHILFRAGLTFGYRPSGPRIYGSFAVSFLSQVVLGKLAAPTARRGGGITILLQG
jgi:hypothetical protein